MLKSNKQKFILLIGLIFIVIICVFATTQIANNGKEQMSASSKQGQVVDACEVSESNEALFVGCNGFF